MRLGNRIYMRQAEKLKTIACKCCHVTVQGVLRSFRKVVHLWGTQVCKLSQDREPQKHRKLQVARKFEGHLVYLTLMRTELTSHRQVLQRF